MDFAIKNNELFVDGKSIYSFPFKLHGAIDVGETVIVLLEADHIKWKSSETDIEEANRNMYGLAFDGTVKWRVASKGYGSKDDGYFFNPFMYVTSYGENRIVVHTWCEEIYQLNPENGNLERLYGSELDGYLKDAQQKGTPILKIPSNDSPRTLSQKLDV